MRESPKHCETSLLGTKTPPQRRLVKISVSRLCWPRHRGRCRQGPRACLRDHRGSWAPLALWRPRPCPPGTSEADPEPGSCWRRAPARKSPSSGGPRLQARVHTRADLLRRPPSGAGPPGSSAHTDSGDTAVCFVLTTPVSTLSLDSELDC